MSLPCDPAGVLGGLALRVVEVCWHCDDSTLYLVSKMRLGSLLDVGQDHGRNLLGIKRLGLALVSHFNIGSVIGVLDDFERPCLDISLNSRVGEAPSYQPLDTIDGVLIVSSSLVLAASPTTRSSLVKAT